MGEECDVPFGGNVLEEFCSDMSYSAVGCEFNVKKPNIY